MTTKTNLLNVLFDDADELIEAITILKHKTGKHVIYIKGVNGETFGTARLEQETLSDGSLAYNILLIEDED